MADGKPVSITFSKFYLAILKEICVCARIYDGEKEYKYTLRDLKLDIRKIFFTDKFYDLFLLFILLNIKSS